MLDEKGHSLYIPQVQVYLLQTLKCTTRLESQQKCLLQLPDLVLGTLG